MSDNFINGQRLGKFLSFGLSNTGAVPAELWNTLLKLYETQESEQHLQGFLQEADLEVIIDRKNQWFTLMPGSKDSVFRMKADDIRAKLKEGGKAAFFAYANMAVIATFYPSKFALSTRQFTEVKPESVYAVIDKMAEYVEMKKGYQKEPADEHMIAVGTEFVEMQRTKDGKGMHPNFQEFYVLAALRSLVEGKWIKEEKTGFVPLDRFATMVHTRLNTGSFALSVLLERFYDHYEE
jgi:hypothetical protein